MTTRTVETKDRPDGATATVRQAAKLAVQSGSVHGFPAHVGLKAQRKIKPAA